jgi:hypothetical protein
MYDIILIERGDDAAAADEFMRLHGDRLIKRQGRILWEEDGIYIKTTKEVKNKIMDALRNMKIFLRTSNGPIPYSRSVRRMRNSMKLIMAGLCNTYRDIE